MNLHLLEDIVSDSFLLNIKVMTQWLCPSGHLSALHSLLQMPVQPVGVGTRVQVLENTSDDTAQTGQSHLVYSALRRGDTVTYDQIERCSHCQLKTKPNAPPPRGEIPSREAISKCSNTSLLTYIHTHTHTGSVAVLCRSAGYYQLFNTNSYRLQGNRPRMWP